MGDVLVGGPVGAEEGTSGGDGLPDEHSVEWAPSASSLSPGPFGLMVIGTIVLALIAVGSEPGVRHRSRFPDLGVPKYWEDDVLGGFRQPRQRTLPDGLRLVRCRARERGI